MVSSPRGGRGLGAPFSIDQFPSLCRDAHQVSRCEVAVTRRRSTLRFLLCVVSPVPVPVLLLVAVAVIVYAGCCGAQLPIPARTDGFVWGAAPAPEWGGAVVVEAFFDPVCPDSRDAWPPLQKAAQHYGAARVAVVVHLFPLPYHSNAFIACRSIHTVNKINASAVYPLLEKFFKYQEGYYNQPTYTKSRATVVDEITNNLVAPIIGEANLAAYKSGFNDSQSDQATRISFKYGCARGVTGTPYFFVNGMPLGDSGSPVDYNKWISTLDPLVGKM